MTLAVAEASTAPAAAAPVPTLPPAVTAARRTPAEVPSTMTAPPLALRRNDQTSLNPTFTFASFVSGKANQLARAAGMQVADHPTSYNPLFVYGGVGLGKTHLLQAIGNHILQREPAARIRYIHAEPTSPTSSAPTSTSRSTTSSAITARSTCC